MRAFAILLCFILSASVALAQQVIVYGYDEDYPPWETSVAGEPVGINIDIMNALAARLGWRVDFKAYPFKRVLLLLENGGIDMAGGLARTDEREAYAQYLEPAYQRTHKIFIMRNEADFKLETYADLAALRIGMRTGHKLFEPFDSDPRLLKVEVNSVDQLFRMLLADRTDVIVGGAIQLRYAAKTGGYSDQIKIAPYSVETDAGGFFALSRASKLIGSHAAIQLAFEELLTGGVIDAIVESHLN